MRYMIASDLHGSAYYCDKMWEAYDREKADRLIFLGDILYHGPRNDLPRDYQPKKVTASVNARKQEFLAVRGNCEAEVDQMVLEFPVMAEYALLSVPRTKSPGEALIFITHGHVFNEEHLPMLKDGDILLHGHTHIPVCRDHGSYVYMNPGSLSLPKENSRHSYMMLEDGCFVWKDLETGEKYMEYRI